MCFPVHPRHVFTYIHGAKISQINSKVTEIISVTEKVLQDSDYRSIVHLTIKCNCVTSTIRTYTEKTLYLLLYLGELAGKYDNTTRNTRIFHRNAHRCRWTDVALSLFTFLRTRNTSQLNDHNRSELIDTSISMYSFSIERLNVPQSDQGINTLHLAKHERYIYLKV